MLTKPPVSMLGFDETDYRYEALNDSQKAQLVTKVVTLWRNSSRYWYPYLEEGQDNFEAIEGRCFTDQELDRFRQEDKEPIQVPIILSRIMSLSGMQRSGRRDGIVVGQGGDDAAPADVVNKLLKVIRQRNHLDQQRSDVFFQGIVSGYPCFLWLEKSTESGKGIDAYSRPWNSTIADPNFTKLDLSDTDNLFNLAVMTKDRTLAHYPQAEAELARVHPYGDMTVDQSIYEQGLVDANERHTLFTALQDAQLKYTRTGLITVVERLFFRKKTMMVWYDPLLNDARILPMEWSPVEVLRWRAQNPSYQMQETEMKVLWVTTCTATGALLENRPHWFQEERFPCGMYVASMRNNAPRGVVSTMKVSQKMNSIGRTQYVHSLRYAHDQLMKVKEGALVDAEQSSIEKSRTGGVIVLKDDAMMDDVEFVPNNVANQGYVDLSNIASSDLDEISNIQQELRGEQASANDTRAAMDRRITMQQSSQGMYFDNFDIFDVELHRTILKMLPYVFTEHQMHRYTDENNQEVVFETNAPVETDPITGAVTRVKNRLDACDYDYLQAVGDNSVTGQAEQNAEFAIMSQQVLPTIPRELWVTYLRSMPNMHAQKFAADLEESEKNQAEAQKRGDPTPARSEVRMNLNIAGADIQTRDPMIMDVLKRQGIVGQVQPGPQKTVGQVKAENKQQQNQGVQNVGSGPAV